MGLFFRRRKPELPPKLSFGEIYDIVMSIECEPDTPTAVHFKSLANGNRFGYGPSDWLEIQVIGKILRIAPHGGEQLSLAALRHYMDVLAGNVRDSYDFRIEMGEYVDSCQHVSDVFFDHDDNGGLYVVLEGQMSPSVKGCDSGFSGGYMN